MTSAEEPKVVVPDSQVGRLLREASDMIECALTFLPPSELRSSILPNLILTHFDLPCTAAQPGPCGVVL